jgi:Sec-independent protein translocase protein TatA
MRRQGADLERYHPRMSDVGLVLVVILVLVIIWRGPRTLPKIGQALGRGVKAAREEAKSIGEGTPPPTDDPDPTERP